MIQDNRIPKVTRNFTDNTTDQDVLSFLTFKDWLNLKETESKDWLVVAQYWLDDTTDLFTFSTLATITENSLQRILSKHDWEIDPTFGHPTFYTYGSGDEIHYHSGMRTEIDGIEFRPFIIYRKFHGFIPHTFELVQNFILYHNAFYVPEKSEYHRIDDDGDIQQVARFEQQNNNLRVLVDVHHLRDYLAANKCYLVRYHDHRRRSVEDISQYIKEEPVSHTETSTSSIFNCLLYTDTHHNNYKSWSKLLGKDTVWPYNEPSHTGYTINDSKKRFASFVIGRDEYGKEIEATCSEDELSNYFIDRGNPHFLTPVFFQRKVLAKYYQEPSRYQVNDSSLSCLDIWSLPIDTTKEKLIQVWLGDLGRIPYNEQLHWRQFNVVPRGTITSHRYLRDFIAEFSDPANDPIYYLRIAFETLQKVALERLSNPFFQDLDEKDRHVYETLHLPLTDEWKEFDEQIQALAKVTVDSINVSSLSRESGQRIDGKIIKGSIDLLGHFLVKIGVQDHEREQILSPFHAIQSIRSTGAAHRKGANFEKALQKFQLSSLTNHDKIEKLVIDLTRALNLLAEILRQQ